MAIRVLAVALFITATFGVRVDEEDENNFEMGIVDPTAVTEYLDKHPDAGNMEVVIQYFSGDDKQLDDGEFDALKEAIGIFDGKDNVLQKEERELLEKALKLFDTDGDGDLDTDELYGFMKVIRYFAGDDTELEESEFNKMKEAIGLFDGTDNKLQKVEITRLVLSLQLFDTDGDRDLDPVELKGFMDVVKYFAGDPEDLESGVIELDNSEFSQMHRAIDIFDGKDDKLQKTEILTLVERLAAFDTDGDADTDLDTAELYGFMQVVSHFAGDDQELADSEIKNMDAAIRFFDGEENDEENELDKPEIARLVQVLALFDTDTDGDLDPDELDGFMKVIKYFAGDDKELQQNEFESMMTAIDTFDGPENKLDKDEITRLKAALALFDTEPDGDLDEKELKCFMEKIKAVAGDDNYLDASEFDALDDASKTCPK